MRNLFAVCFALMFSLSAEASRDPVPMSNFENVSLEAPSGKALGMSDIRTAIVRAASKQAWTLVDAAPGKLTATLNVNGKHMVIVDIVYSVEKFSVIYVDSMGIKAGVHEGVPVIHPSYNRWLQNLVNGIRLEAASSRI
ncbi:MAG TPA: hypothetical protein PLW86_18360 [Rhodocyclaceae bacterium]|nr:hypothetical protein [Rhodocyclaceae bacterium]